MAVGGKVNFEVDDGMSIGQRENCGMCNTREHDGFCSQCDIYVCQICYDLHLNIKLCKDHSLLLDSKGRNRRDSTILFEICDEHKGQEVKAYCTEHKCCVCIECIVLHHKSCEWEYIVDASNRFQDSGDLARLLEEVHVLEYTLGKYMEAIDKHTKTAETIDKDVVSDIETFAESLVKYVTGSKQQALDDAKVRESAHQQVLDKLRVDIQSLVSQVEEVITDFRNEDMVHKRFILAVATTPKVDKIQNEIAAIDCDNVITDYTFRPGNFLKRMMSNTRPIGRLTDASHIGEEDEDDDDIKLKERERSQGLEQQLEENQKMMSKLKKDLHDMEQRYGGVVKDKQSLTEEVCALRDNNQSCRKEKESIEHELCTPRTAHARVVRAKQSLEQQIGVQKSINQNVVSKLNKDLGDVKQNYDRAVMEKQSLELQIDAQKSRNENVVSKLNKDLVDTKQKYDGIISKMKQELDEVKQHGPAVTLSCKHENLVGHLGENKLIKCRTCGIINGDQPDGTFTTANTESYTELTFKFPNGTQSKLNRTPGQPYYGKTVSAFLIDDTEGTLILNMMSIAFGRKSMFTFDIHGNIKNEVELFRYNPENTRRIIRYSKPYTEYIARVRKQLEERGIKESDVTQL